MPPFSSARVFGFFAPKALYRILIVAVRPTVFHQHEPAVARPGNAIPKYAQRSMGNERFNGVARDLGSEHIGAEAQVFRRLHPAGFRNLLVFEKLSRSGP